MDKGCLGELEDWLEAELRERERERESQTSNFVGFRDRFRM